MRKTTIVLRTLVAALALISSACGGSTKLPNPTGPDPVPIPSPSPSPGPAPGPAGTPWPELPHFVLPEAKRLVESNVEGNFNFAHVEKGVVKNWTIEVVPVINLTISSDFGTDEDLRFVANTWSGWLDGTYNLRPVSGEANLKLSQSFPPPWPVRDTTCASAGPHQLNNSVIQVGLAFFKLPCIVNIRMIMLHEVGHLLLGTAAHTDTGDIMSESPRMNIAPATKEAGIWLTKVKGGTRPI